MRKTKKKTIGKILSAVLAVCMVFGATSVTAFATTLDQNNTSGSATVYYQAGQVTDDNGTEDPTDDTVGGTYTVTIPAYIEAAATDSAPAEYDVTAKDVLIPYGTSLKIAVDFESNLKLADDASVTIGYDMQAKQGESALASVNTGATILTAAAGNPDAVTTASIAAVLTDAPIYSGTYTNTAIFNVTVA